MTDLECYSRGYLAGLLEMQRRAFQCAGGKGDIKAIPAHMPVVGAGGNVLLRVTEHGDPGQPCPEADKRLYSVAYAWKGPRAFGETSTALYGRELDEAFPGWQAMAEVVAGRPPADQPKPPQAPDGAAKRSEAPEPPGGFTALSEAELWKVMWAAGYELPPAEKFVDPSLPPDDDMHIATVTGGPFEGKMVAVCERAGPWAAVELGVSGPDDTDWFAAVRLCHLRFWSSVQGIDFTKDGKRVLFHKDPPHVPPAFDHAGNLKCPDPNDATAAGSRAGGGPPETRR